MNWISSDFNVIENHRTTSWLVKAGKHIEERFVDLDSGEFVDKPANYDYRKFMKDPKQSEALSGEEDLASIALAFCLSYDAVSTVIPGNISVAQLTQNVASVDHRISKTLQKELEAFYLNEVAPLQLPW